MNNPDNLHKKNFISASMMCSRLAELKETIKIFENEHIDYLHIDVMDGSFVPNFGLGCDYIRGLRELTDIPLDLHLMISRPEQKLDWMDIRKNDVVSVHYESTPQIQKAIDILKNFECKRFIAINPATPIFVLEEMLEHINGVNILMVNPGFAGQKAVPSAIQKVKKLRKFLDDNNKKDIVIEVDGNITNERAEMLKECGADMFVAGSSSVFRGDIKDYGNNIKIFAQYIGNVGGCR